MMEINALHPFREGKGRTQRIFLNQLAENADYKMDLNLISEYKMVTACKLASKLKPEFLENLIKENLNQFNENKDTSKDIGDLKEYIEQNTPKQNLDLN